MTLQIVQIALSLVTLAALCVALYFNLKTRRLLRELRRELEHWP